MRLKVAASTVVLAALVVVCVTSPSETAQGGTNGHIYTVNTAEDNNTMDLECSLREAITASNIDADYNGCTGVNSNTDTDTIQFALGAGTPAINIGGLPLPSIMSTVILNGATGGATRVEIHGPGPGSPMNGLFLENGATFSHIRNLVINNFVDESGITGRGLVISAQFVTVTGNLIGTNSDGTAAVPNSHGVLVFGEGAQIGLARPGDACTGDCNLISGNIGTGLGFSNGAGDGDVEGNFIGTDVTGSSAIPNGTGIGSGANNLSVGEAASGAGNVISGNTAAGIDATSATTIVGNRIGTNSSGTAAVPNAIGIYLTAATSSGVIGGTGPGAGNLISGNLNVAIGLNATSMQVYGNLIGTAADGVTPLPNGPQITLQGSPDYIGAISIFGAANLIGGFQPGEANVIAFNTTNGVVTRGATSVFNQIRGNSIHSNAFKGIENDDGGNAEIPPPVILAAGPTGASGTSDLAVCGMSFCSIEIYSDLDDEGREYEGSTITDVDGDWTFTGSLSGPNITVTATENHTSEFSAPFEITPATTTPSPSPSPLTPTTTPFQTPTVTPTPTPTATPTPTTTPTPTSPGQQVVWGDHNCSGAADPVDALLALRHDAGLSTQTNECPEMGAQVDVTAVAVIRLWGDLDCSGAVDPVDALKGLRFDAALPITQSPGCPDAGQQVMVVP